MKAEVKLTVANPEIKPTYYYFALDKSIKHPLQLLSDVGAFRLKKNGQWEQVDQLMKQPLIFFARENIRIYSLRSNQDFCQLTESFHDKNLPVDVFPVFQSSSGNILVVTDEIIVHFQKETPDNTIEQILRANGLEIITKSSFASNQYVLRVLDATNFKQLCTANSLNQVKSVLFSAPNFLMKYTKEQE